MTEHSISLQQLAKVKDGTGHSIFGASSSHMYLACPGSLIPNILATDTSGPDAAYGTVAHAVTEEWLNTGRPPSHLVGQSRFVGHDIETGYLVHIDDEMLHYAGQCVDRCEWEPGEQYVEVHVDFSHLTPIPNQGGTADFIAVHKQRITVADHKFGASPENIVYAEDNPQLMLYAIGAWRLPQFEDRTFNDFVIRINQPRLNHFDDWHTTSRRLAEFEDYARERMAAAWQLDAPRTPGPKQCRFCKVRATCAANAKMQEDLISAVFSDETETQTVEQMQDFVRRLDDDLDTFRMHFRSANDLTTAQLAKLKPFRAMADAWWNSMAAELDRRAAHGEKIPGYKIVEGRSHRKFISEARARDQLLLHGLKRSDIITESLVSPSQAEKLLRKVGHKAKDLPELLQGLVIKPPGRATLAPLSDRRPEVEDVSAVVFENHDDDETANPEDENEGL
jgi:Protein of unknown function (DUF2800)